MTLLERFEAKYIPEPNSGCWLWVGAMSSHGYGHIGIMDNGKQRFVLAHRVSWFLHHGCMPPPIIRTCHKCDMPLCVNPEHLFLGTHQDNMDDMIRKGRDRKSSRKGSLNQMSILTEDFVWEILRSKKKYLELAAVYGCSESTIGAVKRGQNWPHIFQQWSNEQANARTEARL